MENWTDVENTLYEHPEQKWQIFLDFTERLYWIASLKCDLCNNNCEQCKYTDACFYIMRVLGRQLRNLMETSQKIQQITNKIRNGKIHTNEEAIAEFCEACID